MKKIKPNSIEAVFYFALYICMQDGKFTSEEKEQMFIDMPIVKKLYLDLYGELLYDNFKSMCNNFFLKYEIEESFIGSDINDTEISGRPLTLPINSLSPLSKKIFSFFLFNNSSD